MADRQKNIHMFTENFHFITEYIPYNNFLIFKFEF